MIDLTSLRGIERNDNPTCGKTVLACGLPSSFFEAPPAKLLFSESEAIQKGYRAARGG